MGGAKYAFLLGNQFLKNPYLFSTKIIQDTKTVAITPTSVVLSTTFGHTAYARCIVRLRIDEPPRYAEVLSGSVSVADYDQIVSNASLAHTGAPFLVRMRNLVADTHYTAYCSQHQSRAMSRCDFKTLRNSAITSKLVATKISTTIATLSLTFGSTGNARCLLITDDTVVPTSEQIIQGSIPSLDSSIAQLPQGGDSGTVDATEAIAGTPFSANYNSLVPGTFYYGFCAQNNVVSNRIKFYTPFEVITHVNVVGKAVVVSATFDTAGILSDCYARKAPWQVSQDDFLSASQNIPKGVAVSATFLNLDPGTTYIAACGLKSGTHTSGVMFTTPVKKPAIQYYKHQEFNGLGGRRLADGRRKLYIKDTVNVIKQLKPETFSMLSSLTWPSNAIFRWLDHGHGL